jgi:hypothetical protein
VTFNRDAELREAGMLTSHHERFSWSRQDRMAEPSFFRLLQQHWRPVSRAAVVDERIRRHAARPDPSKRYDPTKPAWTPWLWVGR